MYRLRNVGNKILVGILSISVLFVSGYLGSMSTVEAADNYVGQTWNYSYCGYVSSWTAPVNAIYKLEVYGAGGDSYGGYSSGYIKAEEGETLYICCGGHGGVSTSSGGYNGGGNGTSGNAVATLGSGGGATHIATTNRGVLSNYSNYQSEILLVAGGGGGRCAFTDYANEDDERMPNRWSTNGGGLTSNSTQIGGAGFGKGQDATGGTYCAAGGGGFYGGNNIGSVYSGGKGGTGYIGGVPSFSFNDIAYSPSSAQGAGAGAQANGYAKITLAAFLIYITTTDTAVAPEDANFTSEASFSYLNVASFKVQKLAISSLTTPSTIESDWITIYECPDMTTGDITLVDTDVGINIDITTKTLFQNEGYEGIFTLSVPVNNNTVGYWYRIIGYMEDDFAETSAYAYLVCRYTQTVIDPREIIIDENGDGVIEVEKADGTSEEYAIALTFYGIEAQIEGAISYKWQYRWEADDDEDTWFDIVTNPTTLIVNDDYNMKTLSGTSTLTLLTPATQIIYAGNGTYEDPDNGIYYRLVCEYSGDNIYESDDCDQYCLVTDKVLKLFYQGNKIRHVYLTVKNADGSIKTPTYEIKGVYFNLPENITNRIRDYLYYGY